MIHSVGRGKQPAIEELSMRKPRDIDAELKALADKAKGLKAKRVLQLGELVTVTGADSLDLETLAGALLTAVNGAKSPDQKEAWRSEGAAFFQRRGRKGRSGVEAPGSGDGGGAASGGDGDPAR
jgi:hypothetical protein